MQISSCLSVLFTVRAVDEEEEEEEAEEEEAAEEEEEEAEAETEAEEEVDEKDKVEAVATSILIHPSMPRNKSCLLERPLLTPKRCCCNHSIIKYFVNS